ncbi:hypothetical protein [Peribacillus loiseleuriae]|uniref:hypothetical protein n=1 Tax=Peribacillus loiseleuriae TaxID=1679170 RepID=UPI000ABA4254|nr:hypothetical protein [Peribacillus loiseleuriae]
MKEKNVQPLRTAKKIEDMKYNLEVLYDKTTNTIYHFEYARKAMGPLPAIPKK